MSVWWPGPWGPMSAVDPQELKKKAEPEKSVEEAPKPRRSRTANTEG